MAQVSRAIAADPKLAATYTTARNTVAVVSDGSAVLGLGDIGPLAAMPVMEGKAVLFKRFGGVDAVPLCLQSGTVEELVDAIARVAPTYGGINDTPTTKQRFPSLASAGGVPYVASQFYPDLGIQVSRLEPEFTSQSASPSANGATLTASAHTYGIPYPIGFRYGTALGSETTPVPAPVGKDDVTVSSQVTAEWPQNP